MHIMGVLYVLNYISVVKSQADRVLMTVAVVKYRQAIINKQNKTEKTDKKPLFLHSKLNSELYTYCKC